MRLVFVKPGDKIKTLNEVIFDSMPWRDWTFVDVRDVRILPIPADTILTILRVRVNKNEISIKFKIDGRPLSYWVAVQDFSQWDIEIL